MDEKKVLAIYKYGDDVLRLKAAEVRDLNGEIAALRDRMLETLYSTPSAIGLAAPQVGESLRFSVIDISRGSAPEGVVVLINPEILEMEGEEIENEGCLSFPNISVPVRRSTRIFLKNLDANGKETRQEIDGFLARVIQHEIDHLDGTLIIDRVTPLRRQLMKKEIRRLQKDGEW